MACVLLCQLTIAKQTLAGAATAADAAGGKIRIKPKVTLTTCVLVFRLHRTASIKARANTEQSTAIAIQ